MKNLRKSNPLLQAFRQQTKQKAEFWPSLDLQLRIDLCVQFIVLPLIESGKPLTQELIDQTLPVAVDLERQVSALLAEGRLLFSTIRDLLEKTVGLYLVGEGE
ncbi:MAG TPA: hypothetical protein V6D23_26765 [Candidatus Obscuribacterales bacterium]